MNYDFKGKVAIVTGGGGGIGREVSLAFANLGAKVTVVDLAEEPGQETKQMIEQAGGEALFVRADVTQEGDIEQFVQQTMQAYKRIDAFINNAGWEGVVMPLVELPSEKFDQVIAVNVRGVFLGMKYVLPVMMEQKSGTVVNTASGAGFLATPNMIGYGASKHAVLGMTKTAAVEMGPYGVRVNAVAPGVVNTRMMRSLEAGLAPGAEDQFVEQTIAGTPTGRYAEPQDIAQTMIYLSSDLSSHITGQYITIDGGASLT